MYYAHKNPTSRHEVLMIEYIDLAILLAILQIRRPALVVYRSHLREGSSVDIVGIVAMYILTSTKPCLHNAPRCMLYSGSP